MQVMITLDDDLAEDIQNITILNCRSRIENTVIDLLMSAVEAEKRRLLRQYVHEQQLDDND